MSPKKQRGGSLLALWRRYKGFLKHNRHRRKASNNQAEENAQNGGGGELSNKAVSVGGELHDVSSGGDSQGSLKNSKSTDLTKPRTNKTTWWVGSRNNNNASTGSAEGPTRLHELEERCAQLEEQLRMETQQKQELESVVVQLRQENEHLQEESQTAAAQLRRFTEWFFQTIDRQ